MRRSCWPISTAPSPPFAPTRITKSTGRCAATLALVAALVPGPASALQPAGASGPTWLTLRPGTAARVDVAPWVTSDEPEAALTQSVASLEHDFEAQGERPGDVLYEPIGVRVVVVRVLPGGRIALVRARDATWRGFAPVNRLVPEIPPGTLLRAAGGFAGFADFFAALDTPVRAAARLATGSELTALASGAAPYDADSSNLVRVRVRIRTGSLRGKTGWIPVTYAGVPLTVVPPKAEDAEKACRCRLVRFDLPK